MGEIDKKEIERLKRLKEEEERKRAEATAAVRTEPEEPRWWEDITDWGLTKMAPVVGAIAPPVVKGWEALERAAPYMGAPGAFIQYAPETLRGADIGARLLGLAGGVALPVMPGGGMMQRGTGAFAPPGMEKYPAAAKAFREGITGEGDIGTRLERAIESSQDALEAGWGYWLASEAITSAVAPFGAAKVGGALKRAAAPLAETLTAPVTRASPRVGGLMERGITAGARGTGEILQFPLMAEEAIGRGIAAPFARFRRPGAVVEEVVEGAPVGLTPEDVAVTDDILEEWAFPLAEEVPPGLTPEFVDEIIGPAITTTPAEVRAGTAGAFARGVRTKIAFLERRHKAAEEAIRSLEDRLPQAQQRLEVPPTGMPEDRYLRGEEEWFIDTFDDQLRAARQAEQTAREELVAAELMARGKFAKEAFTEAAVELGRDGPLVVPTTSGYPFPTTGPAGRVRALVDAEAAEQIASVRRRKPPNTPVDTPQATSGGPEPTAISADIRAGFGADPKLTTWSKGVNWLNEAIGFITGAPRRLPFIGGKRELEVFGALETAKDIRAGVRRMMASHGTRLAYYIRLGKPVFGAFDKNGRIMDDNFLNKASNTIGDEIYMLTRPTIQDVAARMDTYSPFMTEEQLKFMESLRDIFENGTKWVEGGLTREMPGWNAILRDGLPDWDSNRVRPDIEPGGFYLSRGPAKPPGPFSEIGDNELVQSFIQPGPRLNKDIIAENRARSPSMSNAIANGVVYDTFEDAMVGHINEVANKLADINVGTVAATINRNLPKTARRTITGAQLSKRLKIGQLEGLENEFVEDELAMAISRALRERSFSLPIVREINTLYRGFKATWDFSAIGIHGAAAAWRRPKEWSKAAKISLQAFYSRDSVGVAAAMLRGADETARGLGLLTSDFWATAGLRIGGVGTEYAIPALTRLAQGRIPVLKQAAGLFERFNISFGTFGDALRLDWANKLLAEELRRGRTLKELWDTGEMREMASIANKLTGWTPGRFGGDIGDIALFAPKYFLSRGESAVQALSGTARFVGGPLGVRQTIQGREAMRTIAQMMFFGVSLTEIINAATGHETDRRPWVDGQPNPNFYVIRYGGQDFSRFGPMVGFLQAIANTVTGHPERAMRSLGSGFSRIMWDNFTGFAFGGEEALITVDELGNRKFTNPQRAMEYLASLVLPIAPGQVGEQFVGVAQQIPAAMQQLVGVEPEEELVGPSPVERVIGGTIAAGVEVVGGRVSKMSRRDWENEIARDEFGMVYEDLNNNVKPLVDKLVAEKYGARAYLGKKGSLYRKVDTINADFLATLQDIADQHLSARPDEEDFSPSDAKEALQRAQKNRQAALYGSEWDKAKQRRVGGVHERLYDRDEEREEPEPGTREHLLWRYYNLIPDATDEEGLINWDDEKSDTPTYERLSREFWSSLVPGQVDEVLANIRVIEGEYPESMQTMEDAGRYASAYEGTIDGQRVSYWDIEYLPGVIQAIRVSSGPDATEEDVREYMDASYRRKEELRRPWIRDGLFTRIDSAYSGARRKDGVIWLRQYDFVEAAPVEWMLGMNLASYNHILDEDLVVVLKDEGIYDTLLEQPYGQLYKEVLLGP